MLTSSSSFLDLAEPAEAVPFEQQLQAFRWAERVTEVGVTAVDHDGARLEVPTYVNEFWTSRQRAAHSLHEVSYRACFKPQLPRFFIERLTSVGGRVYDPFMGRGTTLLEAALLGRVPVGCDINPLSRMLIEPRLEPPSLADVAARLETIDWTSHAERPADLLVFFHPETLDEILALRRYLAERAQDGTFDLVDAWLRMVAVNRLTGHSPGFFSVYTLPPNQAVSVTAQRKINTRRAQTPPRRHVPALILTKSRALLADVDETSRQALAGVARGCQCVTAPAAETREIATASVDLVVTSPPFLDVVDYAGDNWLRAWFCGIDPREVPLTVPGRIEAWRDAMSAVFQELARVVVPGGHVAFEVGEVRGGRVRLEEHVVPCAVGAGFESRLVVINAQRFTKTAACWGVDNNRLGTNTNRIVVLRRP